MWRTSTGTNRLLLGPIINMDSNKYCPVSEKYSLELKEMYNARTQQKILTSNGRIFYILQLQKSSPQLLSLRVL